MTNLIEKTLLLGFGILTLTIFSSILIPFLGKLTAFNQNEVAILETYMIFINEIDQGISYVEQYPNEQHLKKIDYPRNINISFYDQIAKYEFIVGNQLCVKIYEYNGKFFESYFHNIPPQEYLLNISGLSSLILIDIINLY
jgi:hypothetical protein